MQIAVKELTIPLTGGGTANGFITVADNSKIFPGAIGSLVKSDGTLAQIVKVRETSGSTSIGLIILNTTNGLVFSGYGGSDLSAYPTGSFFTQFAGTVPAQPLFSKV